jgi:hypothetical protein
VDAAENYEDCTMQELFNLAQERMRWWEAICSKRQKEALDRAGQPGAATHYSEWAAASDSVAQAKHNLEIRLTLYSHGLVTKGLFRGELLDAIGRLDGLLAVHA